MLSSLQTQDSGLPLLNRYASQMGALAQQRRRYFVHNAIGKLSSGAAPLLGKGEERQCREPPFLKAGEIPVDAPSTSTRQTSTGSVRLLTECGPKCITAASILPRTCPTTKRDTPNTANRRKRLQPHRYIYGVTRHVFAIDDYIAKVDADAETALFFVCSIRFSGRHGALDAKYITDGSDW